MSKVYYFVKVPLALVRDVRLNRLPEALRWRYISLLILAKEEGDSGHLPPVNQMAWDLRVDHVDQLKAELGQLAQAGLVAISRQDPGDGSEWVVTDFQEFQALAHTRAAEKKRKDRARNKRTAVPARSDQGSDLDEDPDEDQMRSDQGLAVQTGQDMSPTVPPFPSEAWFHFQGIDPPEGPDEWDQVNHPATAVWVTVVGRWPSWDGLAYVIQKLGDQPDPEALARAWTAWKASGYSVRNLQGICDFYRREYKQASPTAVSPHKRPDQGLADSLENIVRIAG